MTSLLAKIPRDRALLLLLAPPLVLLAFLVAGRSPEQYSALPVGVEVTTTTTTVPGPFTAEGVAAQEAEAEVEGTSVSRSGTTSGSGRDGGSRSDNVGAASGGSRTVESAAAATPSSVPAWMADTAGDAGSVATTVPDAATTTVPGETTTTSTTTTTIPDEDGPDPVVDESPIAVLLPISAVLVFGLGLVAVVRRRRSAAPAPPTPRTP